MTETAGFVVRAQILANRIRLARPAQMYSRKRDCECKDCLLWDAEQILAQMGDICGALERAKALLAERDRQWADALSESERLRDRVTTLMAEAYL